MKGLLVVAGALAFPSTATVALLGAVSDSILPLVILDPIHAADLAPTSSLTHAVASPISQGSQADPSSHVAGLERLVARMASRIDDLEATVASLEARCSLGAALGAQAAANAPLAVDHDTQPPHSLATAAAAPLPASIADASVRGLSAGTPWPTFPGLAVPPLPSSWELAMNVDTSDGHNVDYANYDFWQSLSSAGGASTSPGAALTQDFKDLGVFGTFAAAQILVVVHEEGVAKGWRTWELVASDKPLQNYFGGAGRANVCSSTATEMVAFASNVLATVTTGGDEGSLIAEEPLVRNNGVNSVLYTNAANGNDFNRLTTYHDLITSDNIGYGLGTVCDAGHRTSDGGVGPMFCSSTNTQRPICDGQFHTTSGNWGDSGGSVGGMIGTDNVCNSGYSGTCPWTKASGYPYDYAIYVAKKCSPGTASASEATTCTPCAGRTYQPLSHQLACLTCPPATFPNPSRTACLATEPPTGAPTLTPTVAPTSSPVLATRLSSDKIDAPVVLANTIYAQNIYLKNGLKIGAGHRRLLGALGEGDGNGGSGNGGDGGGDEAYDVAAVMGALEDDLAELKELSGVQRGKLEVLEKAVGILELELGEKEQLLIY